MADMTPILQNFLVAVMCILAVAIFLCLLRAIHGPRFIDRLVALNAICTLVILLICILSFVLGASYLIDVAILYGLLNLLAVAILSRITVDRHRQKKEGRS